ncbi:MAG: tRNA pseudouridine(13) synthase TruD [Thiomicrorhabdus sp.]|nr:tRNA pseudouridine(13) synthase TruD [Thiomicrorhabdus sp.]
MNDIQTADVTALNYAWSKPEISGLYKVLPEDFMVEEKIAFELSGEGEHLWCWVEKKGENTDWVAQQLAKWAGISPAKVSVAGQKDRHAITRQWFSLHLPKRNNPSLEGFKVKNITILKTVRHQRKLQKGGLSGNRFTLIIRDIKRVEKRGGDKNIIEILQNRLQAIQTTGVPNYFGEQRFGLHGRNIKQGIKLLAGELPKVKRNQKSLYLSSIRSWLFNVLLSHRVEDGSWNQLLDGDVLQLEGSNKWFVEDGTAELLARIASGDLHPTGALYGCGELPTKAVALSIEEQVVEPFLDWVQGLDQYGVQQARRALRVLPQALTWQWLEASNGSLEEVDVLTPLFTPLTGSELWQENPVLKLSFTLRAGSYATMVVRELLLGVDYQVKKRILA